MADPEGPLAVDEVTLDLSGAREAVERPLPSRVLLPEPMLRYACNQQGCCCSGWRIGFRGADLVRLGKRLSREDLDRLTRDVEFRVRTDLAGDRVVDEFVPNDADGLCRFLEDEHRRCGLHARYGLEALPDLCVDFPVATFTEPDGAAFYFDPVCPSVLDQLAESDGPLELVEVAPGARDLPFQLRARHSKGAVVLKANGVELSPETAGLVRTRVLAALADGSRTPWEHLQAIESAFVRFGRDSAGEFRLIYGEPPGPFLQHLGACLGAHGRNALSSSFRSYRRFVFAFPTGDDAFDRDRFGDQLEAFGEAYERWLGPSEAALAPLLRRYLALCHATPYAAPEGELPRFAGVVTHKLATALRYAAALGATVGREVDRDLMKAALGASEYFYRSRAIAPELMPWFDAA